MQGSKALRGGVLAEGRAPEVVEEGKDPCPLRLGWQQRASSSIEKHHFKASVWPRLLEHERAMIAVSEFSTCQHTFLSVFL